MSDLQVFGPVIIGTDVEDAVSTTLTTWLPAYLRWIERARGLTANWLPKQASITVSNDLDHWPEEGLPSVQIVCPGLADRPIRRGRFYEACWNVSLAAYVSAQDRSSTERLAKYYAAALRVLMIQQSGLGSPPFATGVSWLGESYDTNLPDRAQRTLGRAVEHFSVQVDSVAQSLGGPVTVPTDPVPPAADLPTVQDVDTGIVLIPE